MKSMLLRGNSWLVRVINFVKLESLQMFLLYCFQWRYPLLYYMLSIKVIVWQIKLYFQHFSMLWDAGTCRYFSLLPYWCLLCQYKGKSNAYTCRHYMYFCVVKNLYVGKLNLSVERFLYEAIYSKTHLVQTRIYRNFEYGKVLLSTR